MKVMTVVGTRPEIIRLAAVMERLDATEGIDHVLVHTGQNWDRQLNAVFFEDLGLRLPDHVLDVDVSSLGATLGTSCARPRRCWRPNSPTRSWCWVTRTAPCPDHGQAQAIPTYHMEAGQPVLRCQRPRGDQPAPGGPHGRLQPRLHRARAAESARGGPAATTGDRDRVADDRGVGGTPGVIEGSAALTELGVEPGRYFQSPRTGRRTSTRLRV